MEKYDIKEFDEIRPYEASEMQQAFNDLLADRQFSTIMKSFAPWLPKGLRNGLLRLAFTGVKTPLDFQKRFMKPIVKWIIRKHTDGCTFDDSKLECRTESVEFATAQPSSAAPTSVENSKLYTLNSKLEKRYTFLSNHRDIVLDSAFLDAKLVEAGYPTTVEIGIGDNLLIYPWIKRLVRMNKAFTVRRGLTAHEMMRKENIWIAQREGRAKDSSDHTQDAVLKMLAMGGELRELNICPLTISYEFDPCDYLKAQEFQQKRDNPAFKKSRQDDLDNMKTGIFGYKGRVHYRCGTPINQWLAELDGLPRNEYFQQLSQRIDQEIHAGYRLYPCNYIALDRQEGTSTYADQYTSKDIERFDKYLAGQLAKISIPNKDEAFLRERMLTMYANPVRNYLKTKV